MMNSFNGSSVMGTGGGGGSTADRLREEAAIRASRLRLDNHQNNNNNNNGTNNGIRPNNNNVILNNINKNDCDPLYHQQHQLISSTPTQQHQIMSDPLHSYRNTEKVIVNYSSNGSNNNNNEKSDLAYSARLEWKEYGSSKTQALEEKRVNQISGKPNDIAVHVVAAESRLDITGKNEYTAYLINVWYPHDVNQRQSITIERRYSDFYKLHTILGEIQDLKFPSKHWAGTIGVWNPAKVWFPGQHQNLINTRKHQLDVWLVELIHRYNNRSIETSLSQDQMIQIQEFLNPSRVLPCQREIMMTDNCNNNNNKNWNNPLTFSLSSSIRQAVQTLNIMTSPSLFLTNKSIPIDLLQHAYGLIFLTTIKAGMIVSGKVGTGLVIARQYNNDQIDVEMSSSNWSAPCAIGTVGLGWGAQIGGDVTHYLIVLTQPDALTQFYGTSVTLGAELGVAVGPTGRSAGQNYDWTLNSAYAYAHTQGLFVGISFEGSVLSVRDDVNTKFYGRPVETRDLLSKQWNNQDGNHPIKAAAPLYKALDQAIHHTTIPDDAFRPSRLWESPTSLSNNEEGGGSGPI